MLSKADVILSTLLDCFGLSRSLIQALKLKSRSCARTAATSQIDLVLMKAGLEFVCVGMCVFCGICVQ